MSIAGEFLAEFDDAPMVRATVSFAAAPSGTVLFLIDTGATRTALSPRDANTIFPGYADLDWTRDHRLSGARGIGGTCRMITRPGMIRFRDDRGGERHWVGPIELIEPTADSWTLPSLLGRDILDHFRLTVSRQESLISLDLPSPATGG